MPPEAALLWTNSNPNSTRPRPTFEWTPTRLRQCPQGYAPSIGVQAYFAAWLACRGGPSTAPGRGRRHRRACRAQRLSPLRAARRARGRGDPNLGPTPGVQIIDSETSWAWALIMMPARSRSRCAGVPAAALADPPQGPSPARPIMVPLPLASCAGAWCTMAACPGTLGGHAMCHTERGAGIAHWLARTSRTTV
jgi:hypothetical protein